MSAVDIIAFIAIFLINIFDKILGLLLNNKTTSPKRGPRSIEVGKAAPGEGAPRRAVECKDNLISTFSDDVSNLYHIVSTTAKKYGNERLLGTRPLLALRSKPGPGGKAFSIPEYGPTEWLSCNESLNRVNNLGSGLYELGARSGARVGIYEDTKADWIIAAFGSWSQGLQLATVYSTLGLEALAAAIQECEMSIVFTNSDLIAGLISVSSDCPTLKFIIYSGPTPSGDVQKAAKDRKLAMLSFKEVEESGKKANHKPNLAAGSSVAVIMYTSGSTGRPKGVLMLHSNVIAAIAGTLPRLPEFCSGVRNTYIGYLPLAHVLELVSELAVMSSGGCVGYGSPRTLTDQGALPCGDLKEFKPSVMAGVPRVWDTIKKAIESKMASAHPSVSKLFSAARAAKKARSCTPLWDFIIFKKMKAELGGELVHIVSGGAPLSTETSRFLQECFGLTVSQGYGLTETCGSATLQEPDDTRPGVVGPPSLCNEIKLVSVPEMNYFADGSRPEIRGEVLIRGMHVTSGYFKMEKETKEVYLPGNWFASGDVGQWTDDGCLKIIDRKKNICKLSHGEYIAIEKMEMINATSSYVTPNGVFVYADGFRSSAVAIVVPDRKAIAQLASSLSLKLQMSELFTAKPIVDAVLKDIQNKCKESKLKGSEVITALHLTDVEWTPESGLLTTSMKLNRNALKAKYMDIIEALYKK